MSNNSSVQVTETNSTRTVDVTRPQDREDAADYEEDDGYTVLEQGAMEQRNARRNSYAELQTVSRESQAGIKY